MLTGNKGVQYPDIENRFYMNPTTQYTKNWSVLVNDIYLIIPDKDMP